MQGQNSKQDESEIKDLLDKISDCDYGIAHAPQRPSFYNSKAKALVKLYKLINDKKYIEEALTCHSKAVELAPYDRLYLAERSKLYTEIGEVNLAIKDLVEIIKLPKSNDFIKDTAVKYIFDDIMAIDIIKSTIKRLVEAGEIENIFEELAITSSKVTSPNLVERIEDNGKRLDEQVKSLHELNKQIADLTGMVIKLCTNQSNLEIQNHTLLNKLDEETDVTGVVTSVEDNNF
ncbi:MAG: Tetratricopeptide repeat-containing protein [Rickettsiaceae bacterium]|jgi:tetratricopeptide (TPR) repeat protein|nr:Tetratricopeptide repeat-containing protein [Rickettsiaceae bacterium]